MLHKGFTIFTAEDLGNIDHTENKTCLILKKKQNKKLTILLHLYP